MYPNPQDAFPLPPRPNLEQYKKLAKELVKACKSADPDAIGDWAERFERSIDNVEEFARKKLQEKCSLANAQFVIARVHGFLSWPKFAKHIEALASKSSAISRFESAADAIVTGDAATLKRLLRENPDLIRARSTREHRGTLLHYISANGHENYRQKTPRNAVEIAKILIDAGAEVDAGAEMYGPGATALGLVATSVHPHAAGVQIELMELLLQAGASVNGGGSGGGATSVRSCLANGRGEAADYLAERGARLDLETAAGVGRLDLVKRFLPESTKEQKEAGFLWACGYGHTEVAEFLLDSGVDIAAHEDTNQTGLHMAAIGGHLDTIQMLLKRKAPLELRNVYGGTVLGQAVWSAAHRPEADYVPIIETLIEAGAETRERHPPVNARVDAVLERYGSHADPSLSWYGEQPRRRKRPQ